METKAKGKLKAVEMATNIEALQEESITHRTEIDLIRDEIDLLRNEAEALKNQIEQQNAALAKAAQRNDELKEKLIRDRAVIEHLQAQLKNANLATASEYAKTKVAEWRSGLAAGQ